MIWHGAVEKSAALCLLYLKGEAYEPHEIRIPILEKEWRDNLGNWRFCGRGTDGH